jgi:DNA polymerase-3 subunit gamma/tau
MSLFPELENRSTGGGGEPPAKAPPKKAARKAEAKSPPAKSAQPPPGSYLALARKYRPGSFGEVIGQDAVIGTLTNAIEHNRLHHAYLFSGIRGVGKTTIARLFARALNCERGPTPSPCGECDPCTEIASGMNLDVIELDAASNRGVDDVEPLREAARYAPSRDRNKVFILDEAHMLSNAAFNSLLKILEEPPPRIVWILATTEYRKVPPTVVSRCQHFEFHRVPRPVVSDYLRRITRAENVKVDDEGLDIISATAGGSVRDAVSLLDQAIAYSGASATADNVREAIGVIDRRLLISFLKLVGAKEASGLLDLIESMAASGTDFSQFAAGLVTTIRDATVLRFAPEGSRAVAATEDEARELRELAGHFNEDGLLRLFNSVLDLPGLLRGAPQPRFVLEAAALRLTRLADLTPIEEVIRGLRGTPAAPQSTPPTPSSATPAAGGGGSAPGGTGSFSSKMGIDLTSRRGSSSRGASAASVSTTAAARPAEAAQAAGASPACISPPAPTAGSPTSPAPPGNGDETDRFIAAVQSRKISLRTFLEAAREIRTLDDSIRVVFAPKQTYFRQSLSSPESQAILREAAAEALGREMAIEVVTEEPPAGGAAPVPGGSANGQGGRRERLIQEAMSRPGVKMVIEELGAQIVDIRDLS